MTKTEKHENDSNFIISELNLRELLEIMNEKIKFSALKKSKAKSIFCHQRNQKIIYLFF